MLVERVCWVCQKRVAFWHVGESGGAVAMYEECSRRAHESTVEKLFEMINHPLPTEAEAIANVGRKAAQAEAAAGRLITLMNDPN